MGTHGLRARGGVKRLTAGRRGGGRRVLFVASIGLLPALAGCSSFSPSSASNAAGPPNNSSVVGGQSAAPSGYPPAVATAAAPPPAPHYAPATLTDPGPRGYLSVAGAAELAPSTEDTGPSGLLVGLFKSNSTPPAQTAAVPSPPRTYAPSAPATLTDPGPRGYLSVAGAAESAPSTEDTGPSGLLVALFKSTSTPPAGSANMPHPPSTYTASAPPYTPPPAQPAAPAPPPTSSAQ
jgi:hypothetical protein